METFVGIIVLFGAIVLAFRLRHSKDSSNPARTPPTPQRSSIRKPPQKNRNAQPSRYEEQSSKHLPQTQILTGAAYVTDGDTIKIKNTQVRLFGIDAPELNHPYGQKAKWALHKLCKGHVVRAEITDKDAYGRTVAKCFLADGRDLSSEMVKQGLAIDWPKYSGGTYKLLETSDARKKLFLADARQKGRMHVWEKYEAKQCNQ